MRGAHARLGDLLVQSGVITQAQFEQAHQIQNAGREDRRHKRRRLGKILVELNFITESRLADALAQQLNLPRVNLAGTTIPQDIIQLIPGEVAESRVILPYSRTGNRLVLAMSDPLDLASMDDVRFRTGLEVSACVAAESDLLATIDRSYNVEDAVDNILRLSADQTEIEFVRDSDEDSQAPQVLQQLSQAAPIVKLVSTIILDAIRRRATDIHIAPRETFVQVRYRIDGNLQDIIRLPKRVQNPMISRVKILGSMDIANRMSPQDGSARLRSGKNHVDLRISTLPATFGETVVIRILDRNRGLLPLPKLGVPDILIRRLQEAGGKSQGMIVVTGPTGSGKTTTLYAFLQWLQDPAVNIITIEDPVEYSIPGITQVSVREQAGLGFPDFMRSALRQDPDIILVGEVRDLETAEIAIRAALTGHLVLTTLHTNDTVSSIVRLADLGIPNFLISSSLTFLVAQRLVRRICVGCRAEIPFPDQDLPPDFPHLNTCYQGRGCPDCNYTGYFGQVGIFECLEVTPGMKRLIANGAPEGSLREEACNQGMVSLFEDAWNKVEEGITTVSEVMGKVPHYGDSPPMPVSPGRAADPPEPGNRPRATIILVDTDADHVRFFRDELDPLGFLTIPASWQSAYQTICRENPDLLVINTGLPESDWPALTARLQASMWTVTIPVLMIDKAGTKGAESSSPLSGVAGVLSIPFDASNVRAQLTAVLN